MTNPLDAIPFDNSYARDLEGFYARWPGTGWPDPKLLLLNAPLAERLGLSVEGLRGEAGVGMLSGSALPAGADPLAQAYAGHQFGNFVPQLGDGRAILIGEVIDLAGQRQDIQLKGAGRTPFARGGDGRAVLGPVLREYLISEAMAAMGVPTTRALAACTTGEQVLRQNGPEPGAVLARVGASHLRVGTFQFFAARGEGLKVRQLADYAIARHDPDLQDHPDRYLRFLERVGERQAWLVAQWMGLGFVHGVMNTDNMTISGQTIDYGPCAFLEAYDPATVFSSIDHLGRYAYGNQPAVLYWNIARLAEALLDLIDTDQARAIERATDVIDSTQSVFADAHKQVFAAKLGLVSAREDDGELIGDLLAALERGSVDFTFFFGTLSDAARGDTQAARGLFADPSVFDAIWPRLVRRMSAAQGGRQAAATRMEAVNPLYIPRNHLVEEALGAASRDGDMNPFLALLARCQTPFSPVDGAERFAAPAPADTAPMVTYCGT